MDETKVKNPDIFYSLDKDNNIVVVGPGWDEFAADNGAPELESKNLIGKPVLNYFFDEATRRLYVRMFERVRKTGEQISFEYRCDSPSLRRYMRLTVSPSSDQGVTILSETLSKEPREEECFQWVRTPGAAQRKARLRNMVLMSACGVCSKVQVRSGDWVEIERALKGMDLTTEPWFPLLTSTICSQCEDMLGTSQD
jgi:hypothetical protein